MIQIKTVNELYKFVLEIEAYAFLCVNTREVIRRRNIIENTRKTAKISRKENIVIND